MIGAALVLEGLGKRFEEVHAVRDFSLEINAGEFLSLLGSSGSGKSTVLRMIAGLEEPTTGRILIDSRDATHLPPESRKIGMVFQDYALFPHMSVWQNIAFPLRMLGTPSRDVASKVQGITELVGVGELIRRRPSQLSGGQQQRVALARALVFEPKLLLLDEPLSALDKNLREYMKAEIKQLHRRVGVTVVYVTHDQSEALALSDRIVVMDRGQIVDVDTPNRLYSLPRSRFLAEFVGDANLVEGEIVAVENGSVTVACPLGKWMLEPEQVRTTNGAEPGKKVLVVLRPENLVVGPARGAHDGMLLVSCDVLETLYSGAHTIYSLKARDTGLRLTARCGLHRSGSFCPGASAEVGIIVDRSVLVDRN